MIWLSFLCGFFLGCALASLVYQRKFRHLARAFRDLKAEIDAMRAAMCQGTVIHLTRAGKTGSPPGETGNPAEPAAQPDKTG